MTLDADEFIRRFLLHVLPGGFVNIRHYGFLATSHREQKLALCRQLLHANGPDSPPLPEPEDWKELVLEAVPNPLPRLSSGTHAGNLSENWEGSRSRRRGGRREAARRRQDRKPDRQSGISSFLSLAGGIAFD